MRKVLTLTFSTFLILVLATCYRDDRKKSLGMWRVEKIEAGRVHAVIEIAKSDLNEGVNRLAVDFRLDLNDDHTFTVRNPGLNNIMGKWNYEKDTITLLKDGLVWFLFHVDSMTQSNLYLQTPEAMFVDLHTDSVEFFTGENTKIKLTRQNNP